MGNTYCILYLSLGCGLMLYCKGLFLKEKVYFLFCLQVSKAACILTTQHLMRTLRSKEAAASVNIKTWPTIIDTGIALKERPFS